jgi:1-acyl-sn-glycerol-3-phosphate acyltransferase
VGFRRTAVNLVLKALLDTVCKIDRGEFIQALSVYEPLLIVINHINFLEVPILVTHSYPLRLTGLVKAETWNNPLFAFLFNTYEAIPVNRTGAYRDVFRRMKEAMDRGFFVCISPEGTRSKDGVLGKGKAGIIQLAQYLDTPVLPLVHYGGEKIWNNLRRFRRTPFHFRAGRPFRIRFNGRPGRELREEMLFEVMTQMAKLLPEKMRGIYAGHTEKESKYLEFLS